MQFATRCLQFRIPFPLRAKIASKKKMSLAVVNPLVEASVEPEPCAYDVVEFLSRKFRFDQEEALASLAAAGLIVGNAAPKKPQRSSSRPPNAAGTTAGVAVDVVAGDSSSSESKSLDSVATYTCAAPASDRTPRGLWLWALRRIDEEVEADNAIVLLPGNRRIEKFPHFVFPRTLARRCCGRRFSDRRQRLLCGKGPVGRTAFICASVLAVVGEILKILVFAGAMHTDILFVASSLTLPCSIVGLVGMLEDKMVLLTLRTPMARLYLLVFFLWFLIYCHLFKESPGMLFHGISILPGLTAMSFIDALRRDAFYIIKPLPATLGSVILVMVYMYLCILTGLLPITADTVELKLNLSSVIPVTARPLFNITRKDGEILLDRELTMLTEMGVFQSCTWTWLALAARIWLINVWQRLRRKRSGEKCAVIKVSVRIEKVSDYRRRLRSEARERARLARKGSAWNASLWPRAGGGAAVERQ